MKQKKLGDIHELLKRWLVSAQLAKEKEKKVTRVTHRNLSLTTSQQATTTATAGIASAGVHKHDIHALFTEGDYDHQALEKVKHFKSTAAQPVELRIKQIRRDRVLPQGASRLWPEAMMDIMHREQSGQNVEYQKVSKKLLKRTPARRESVRSTIEGDSDRKMKSDSLLMSRQLRRALEHAETQSASLRKSDMKRRFR